MTRTKGMWIHVAVVPAALVASIIIRGDGMTMAGQASSVGKRILLPQPQFDSRVSIEQALKGRRSIREYKESALTLGEVAQLLWAAQGITSADGLRTAPSAGALYPLEAYLVVGNVRNLDPGVYHYRPHSHDLVRVSSGDVRKALARASLDQEQVKGAAATIVLAAVFERTTIKYRERGRRYVYSEAGHASENIYLQSVALGLGTVAVGAFQDEEVKRVLQISEEPLYLMPVGRRGN